MKKIIKLGILASILGTGSLASIQVSQFTNSHTEQSINNYKNVGWDANHNIIKEATNIEQKTNLPSDNNIVISTDNFPIQSEKILDIKNLKDAEIHTYWFGRSAISTHLYSIWEDIYKPTGLIKNTNNTWTVNWDIKNPISEEKIGTTGKTGKDDWEKEHPDYYDIHYDAKYVSMDLDYSLSNDVFIDDYQKKTNRQLSSFGVSQPNEKLKNWDKPYFTSKNNFYDIEKLFREGDEGVGLISSKFNVPLDSSVDIVFLDDNNNILDKSTNLYSSKINLQIISNNSNKEIIGKTDILHYEIPYFNIGTKNISNNIYDFNGADDSDPTDNSSQGGWFWSGDNWVYKTNEIKNISFDDTEIESYDISQEGTTYHVSHNMNEGEKVDNLFTDKFINQVNNNKSQNYILDVELTNKSDYLEKFKLDFSALNTKDNVIVTANNPDDMKYQNQNMFFDENNDGLATGNEIVRVNRTQSKFVVDTNGSFAAFKWDGSRWNKDKTLKSGDEINEEGIWGFSSMDEYGNNSFEVVIFQKPNTNLDLDSQFDTWDAEGKSASQYIKDSDLSREQGMSETEYQNKNPLEMRAVDIAQQSTDFKNLKNISIDNTNLENITNKYHSGDKTFLDIKDELSEEINNQMINQGFSSSDYKIVWANKDDQTINTDTKISYELKPNGNWTSKGEYENNFSSKAFNNLNELKLSNDSLIKITNDFEQGSEFKSIRKRLEANIKNQLSVYDVKSEALDFNWNLKDTDKVYRDTKINWTISSKDSTLRGENEGSIASESYWNLKHINIDVDKLQTMTTDQDFANFGEARKVMDNEIYNEIETQGYPKDKIRIVWNIADESVPTKNDSISFTLESKNDNVVKSSFDAEFPWAVPFVSKTQKYLLYEILVGFLIFLVIIITFGIYLKHHKNKKIEKQKIANGTKDLNIDDLDSLSSDN